MIWLSIDVCFKWFWLSVDLNFRWCGCQLIWDSSDPALQLIWDWSDLVVNRFEIQMSWVSIEFEIQVIWMSNDWRFKWFEATKKKLSARLPSKMELCSSKTKLFCETSFKIEAVKLKNEAFLRDFLQKWNFEAQKRSFSARLPSKTMLWRSKTKLFCETSFKNGTVKLKNEAFLRDFLQKRCFEDQKQSIFARLPSKMTCRPDTWPQNYNTS